MPNDHGRQRGLRLLSLDGGGIRGVSELVILQEIMHRIQRIQKLDHPPLPSDYFDLICGTSTGGLIAILLGRLKLSVSDAIDKYRILAKTVFSERKARGKDGAFKASKLEQAIKDVVEWKLGSGHADENMFELESSESGEESCKIFVCAVAAQNINRKPRLFRSYQADKNEGYNCTIWEAGRATSAAPTFFKRIQIGPPGLQEDFIDAGLGCNNPVKQLIAEAEHIFGDARDVACIVSIGTGKPEVTGFRMPAFGLQRVLPIDLIKVLKNMATDSEATAAEMTQKYKYYPGVYYRLNVEQGLENVSLEEWQKLGEVKTHTLEYLNQVDISQNIDDIVAALIGTSIPAVDPPRTYYKYPALRVNHFIARENPLREIEATYHHSKDLVDPTVVVLFGIGGSGKTQLALEYCRRTEASRRFTSIFWVDASDIKTTAQSFLTIAGIISDEGLELADADASIRFVTDIISTWHNPWLIVFDNFDSPNAFKGKNMKDYFPRGKNGAILFTSRFAGARRLGNIVKVTNMSESEGLELLLERSGASTNSQNCKAGKEIVQRLGYLALAIDQAGAYISTRGLALHLYIDHYNNRKERVLKEVPEFWEYRKKLGDAEAETSLSVFTTWEMSFEQIASGGNGRRNKEHLLTVSAFFDNKDIFEELFRVNFKPENPGWMELFCIEGNWSEYEFQDVLAELFNLSLVQSLEAGAAGTHFSLHPLIQDWVKLRLNLQDRRTYAMETISMLATFIDVKDAMTLQLKQTVVSHLDASVQNDASFLNHGGGLGTQCLMGATLSFASFYLSRGRYKEAEQLYGQALEGCEKQLGPDHPETLRMVQNFAIVYGNQGRYKEAEQLFERALEGCEKQLGPDHPDTLRAVPNLANIYRNQGRYKEAEQLYERALEGYEKQAGPDHPGTLLTMQNLANVYADQGRYKEAEQLHERALEGYEKQLGPDHPDTLRTVQSLAIVYGDQGRYKEAEQLHERALEGYEKQLGPDHPDTLRTVQSLAIVYGDQGRYKEAEQLHERALEGYEKQLGPDHPETLRTVQNLAIVYRGQGRYKEAEQLHERALEGYEKQLGPDHPETLLTVKNLAVVYGNQGRYKEAKQPFERALEGYEKQAGPDHPETLRTVQSLANVYGNQGQYKEAEQLYERALEGYEKQLGPDHPETLLTVQSLANVYRDQGRYKEAEQLYERALEGYEKQAGPDHPETLRTVQNLAVVYGNQGRYKEAEQPFERALEGYEKQLGPDHPDTLRTVQSLAVVYGNQGRYKEAKQLFERALQGCEKQLGPDHPEMLLTVQNLANVYRDQGRYKEAEQLYERALEGYEKQLGPDHPETLRTVQSLAIVYGDQGRYKEAEQLYERALEGYEKQLGPDHPETLRTVQSLAIVYGDQGRYKEAEQLHERALEGREKQLGPDHPDTLRTVQNLATLRRRMQPATPPTNL
ncbi:hypothetical protein FGG08_003814 [Glutinoglossum americanum]|uniref:PNPLA domain-containing protein n=1 Tax=Glutinoglossum americanum TaxID=1670608 RepID=A0A9P8HXJ0_9PEZI|nr:hypothetical protein FGG08_003814 [Glutinoglossum americanum]